MPSYVYASEDGYSIQGLDPPDFWRFPADVKTMFWGWVVEIGIRQKDRDLAKGLDKDGNKLRAIKAATKKHRRSAMTPSGKGDPAAPPLIPGWQKSRVRSLLTGKAFENHAEFWWKYDPHTGDSFARILEHQAEAGRDVFGLSDAALKRTKAQAWERWEKWKKSEVQESEWTPERAESPRVTGAPIDLSKIDLAAPQADLTGNVGAMSETELDEYLRQTASAKLLGRPQRPKVMSKISGPKYNRMLASIYGKARPAEPGPIAVKPPKPKPVKPRTDFEQGLLVVIKALRAAMERHK